MKLRRSAGISSLYQLPDVAQPSVNKGPAAECEWDGRSAKPGGGWVEGDGDSEEGGGEWGCECV